MQSHAPRSAYPLLFLTFALLASGAARAETSQKPLEKRPLEFVDLMKFRTVVDPVISDDGSWIAFGAPPDRGDGTVEIRSTDGRSKRSIERGTAPKITADGAWVAALVVPSLEETEAAEDPESAPKNGLALVSTASESTASWERVESFAFSEDGQWLMIHHVADDPEEEAEEEANEEEAPGENPEGEAEEAEEEAEAEEEDEKEERLGSTLRLRRLPTGEELEIAHVEHAALAETSDYLAYAIAAPEGENGLFVLPLKDETSEDRLPSLDRAATVTASPNGRYTALAWAEETADLAFVAAVDDDEGEPGDGALWLWRGTAGEGREIVGSGAAPAGWYLPSVNETTWSRDGERLFFGFKPRSADPPSKDDDEGEDDAPFDPYDVEAILDGTELDVWHVEDPVVKTQERLDWEEEKDRTYRAVYHLESGRTVPLADTDLRDVEPTHAPGGAYGRTDVPYLRERTWDGFYSDLYWVALDTGKRRKVATRLSDASPQLSPDGRHLAWYENGHWHLYDADADTVRNLTEGLDVPFANEDHDYPAPVPGYGSPGFLEDGSAVIVYDKYDAWRLSVDPSVAPVSLTDGLGRREQTLFRLWDLDPESDHVPAEGPWLVAGYRDRTKNDGLWLLDPAADGPPRKIHEAEKRFTLLAKAEDADRLLFTRESYREFPDLWVADTAFGQREKLTDLNPQVAEFPWGQAELVEWQSTDGTPLQGVLIRPETLAEGERCPVVTYFYRFFSHRLHLFNEPKVNHRPSFPLYASHGYCIFLPDVRFEIGRPGLSAVKALVPGVQKLVELGIADPDALGLHGHSWSGYQAAFVVTQTEIFAATVAGAPVSNMTSAYGGIRYGSGLARQFQYEKTQSRLGKSLWEGRDLYIENSPLFYADRVRTPLLLQFGDEDEAVPWTQGVELYLALRRLDKEAIFLQYRGEPHHLQNYANKLDYSIKMKEYFDHYLKGAPAPSWITEGVPFRGE